LVFTLLAAFELAKKSIFHGVDACRLACLLPLFLFRKTRRAVLGRRIKINL